VDEGFRGNDRQAEPGAKKVRGGGKHTSHIILGVIAVVALVMLGIIAYAPGNETQFIQNTLGVVAVAATSALAGIERGRGE
jgi:hypothetical protein